MPEERISTLNSPGSTDGKSDSGATEGGASSIPEQTSSDPDFVSTVNPAGTDPEGANNTGDQDKDAGDKGKGEDDKEKGSEKDSDEDRFDKHPRFQELKSQRDEANKRVQRLEEKVDQLTTNLLSGKKAGEEEGAKTFDDMDEDELRDLMDDDPKGFVANLIKQAQEQVFGELETQSEKEARQSAVIAEIDAFAKEHEDFDKMWDEGKIQSFIKDHPGHNSISAYLMLKQDDFITKEEHEKVVKQEIEKDRANRGHKQLASTQGAGGGGARSLQAQAGSPELKDTKSGGGRTSVLVNRLRQRRAQAANG